MPCLFMILNLLHISFFSEYSMLMGDQGHKSDEKSSNIKQLKP